MICTSVYFPLSLLHLFHCALLPIFEWTTDFSFNCIKFDISFFFSFSHVACIHILCGIFIKNSDRGNDEELRENDGITETTWRRHEWDDHNEWKVTYLYKCVPSYGRFHLMNYICVRCTYSCVFCMEMAYLSRCVCVCVCAVWMHALQSNATRIHIV